MAIIDTHAHLYDEVFSKEVAVLTRFKDTGGSKVLMPNINQDSLPLMLDYNARYPQQTEMMLGLHPAYVTHRYQEELDRLYPYLRLHHFIAIGEIGLDRVATSDWAKQQREAFRIQLSWALQESLPISIHAREATEEVLRILKDYPGMRGVLHCFSDEWVQAKMALDLGLYIGVGGVITFKKTENLRQVISRVPLERLLLETDAPYLAPVPYRGKTNEPAYLPYIIEVLATLKAVPISEVIAVTERNACQLFGLSSDKDKVIRG